MLAWQKEVGPKDFNKVNPNGGAIAHGMSCITASPDNVVTNYM